MGSAFQRRLLTGFAFTLILLAGIAYASLSSIEALKFNAGRVTHTQQVVAQAREGLTLLLNAETGQRGYIITGEQRYLEPYNNSRGLVGPAFQELKSLVSDNKVSSDIADSLLYYSGLRLQIMDEVVLSRREKGFEITRDLMLQDKGKLLMKQIRILVEQLEQEEFRLLEIRQQATDSSVRQTRWVVIGGTLLILLLVIGLFYYIQRTFVQQQKAEEKVRNVNIELEAISKENIQRNWLLEGINQLNESLRGEHEVKELSSKVVLQLADYLKASAGAFYLADEHSGNLGLVAYSGLSGEPRESFRPGEGLLGRAALSSKATVLKDVNSAGFMLHAGVASIEPAYILWKPVYLGDDLKGVLELAMLGSFEQQQLKLLDLVGENIAIAIQAAQDRARTLELLDEVQQQSEELQSQQEELRVTNEELTQQSQMLQASEEELKVQQEELQQVNTELEEKAQLLEEKNRVVEEASSELTRKAAELEEASRYKSEFLANMSHELRTPLNSILLLAKMLEQNDGSRLNKEEVKYAGVIYKAGHDLLTLINDILDLSKIESGKLELNQEQIALAPMLESLKLLFETTAAEKTIQFKVAYESKVRALFADQQRIEQVLKNLLSNAFKFTPERGSVVLRVKDGIFEEKDAIYLEVQDTGIGIPEDKQALIFGAFQQADGSTSRKYGGTGLGLSISRQLAQLMGGSITLQSAPGQGSTFSLIIPLQENKEQEVQELKPESKRPIIEFPELKPDRNKRLLVIEDDPHFRQILVAKARNKGFEPLEAATAKEGFQQAMEHKPGGIIMDLGLPDKDGWELLKELKQDKEIAHIPVHIISARDTQEALALASGALGFWRKPVSGEQMDEVFERLLQKGNGSTGHVLLVEDHASQSFALRTALEAKGISVKQAFTGEQAWQLLNDEKPEAVILDLNLPDISGFELLARMQKQPATQGVPVIIHTGQELSKEQLQQLGKQDNTLVLKSGKSSQRLLDEVQLFMHRIHEQEAAPIKKQPVVQYELQHKTILLADDDMRNVFALSAVLQQHGMEVKVAANGREAIEMLEQYPEIAIVLMDVMMPEMDGLEAMRRIRSKPEWKALPIIAVTAKAMKQDREECLAAGASDYISKPVDMDRLISLMQVWMKK